MSTTILRFFVIFREYFFLFLLTLFLHNEGGATMDDKNCKNTKNTKTTSDTSNTKDYIGKDKNTKDGKDCR